MASASVGEDARNGSCSRLVEEFEAWQAATSSEMIFLLECSSVEPNYVKMCFLLAGEHEFTLSIPNGHPGCEEKVKLETGPTLRQFIHELTKMMDCQSMTLSEMLDSAIVSYNKLSINQRVSTSEGEGSDGEDESDEMAGLSEDDTAFTTEWELNIARKKKRWAHKEQEVREALKKARLGPTPTELALHANSQDKEQARQIFTSSAASGILTNDLVTIMEAHQTVGFSADPIDDNIYQWNVKLHSFMEGSELAADLEDIKAHFGYDYIELQLDFAIDLYPFYPPIVKVIRPRLQGSMMQRVTNMEMLKLSYWNPAKNMKDVLVDVRNFLQQWARLEVDSERNEQKRYPLGSYVDIEHYLLHLALVSEVNPRANIKYHLDVEPALPIQIPNEHSSDKNSKRREEFWAAGTGYGHCNRPEWDVKAYLAAQKEKDKQVETVLHKILLELKKLYANHAPQLKPRLQHKMGGASEDNDLIRHAQKVTIGESPAHRKMEFGKEQELGERGECEQGGQGAAGLAVSAGQSCAGAERGKGGVGHVSDGGRSCESVDPVEDMSSILEGSALVPFLESYLLADSFLEICRHTKVYRVIVDVIKELALQPQLVPLLGKLPDQQTSIYQLLTALEQKAAVLLQHICKAGNGSIPKPPKPASRETNRKGKERGSGVCTGGSSERSSHDVPSICTAEEKLAREFQTLFRDVTDAFKRLGLEPSSDQQPAPTPEIKHIPLPENKEMSVEEKYHLVLSQIQFLSVDIDLDVAGSHHYAREFQKQESSCSNQAQVFRIAQELTSLSSSLPLDFNSGIFLRTDDDRLVLMKALIIGPRGTPYSGGCFTFDIFFPPTYPKVPPLVNLQTTGGGTVRFNPNLYNCGKVCLSLLGTWEGQQGEQWNEITSSVLQVLVSIQSLILVPEPYFNEPGYEQEIGTEAGKRHSADYSLDVQINTIKHAMVGQIQNPSRGLEDVIQAHFYLKRTHILQEVEGWVASNKSSRLERAYQNLKEELMKMRPPPCLTNLANMTHVQSAV